MALMDSKDNNKQLFKAEVAKLKITPNKTNINIKVGNNTLVIKEQFDVSQGGRVIMGRFDAIINGESLGYFGWGENNHEFHGTPGRVFKTRPQCFEAIKKAIVNEYSYFIKA